MRNKKKTFDRPTNHPPTNQKEGTEKGNRFTKKKNQTNKLKYKVSDNDIPYTSYFLNKWCFRRMSIPLQSHVNRVNKNELVLWDFNMGESLTNSRDQPPCTTNHKNTIYVT